MPIIIRTAELSDAEALSAYVEGLVAEGTGTITLRRAPTPEEEQVFIRKMADAERAFVLLALDGDRVVGMLDLQAGEREHNRHTGRFGMSVTKELRGQGIGRRILETAIAMTKEWEGFCRIELEVFPHNTAAISLYESLGFELEARKVKAVRLESAPEDLLLMALTW